MVVMSYFKAEVKKYEKKYIKKTKAGTKKEAKTIQYSIPLQKKNPFQEQDFIYILTNNELSTLLDKIKGYESAEIDQDSDSKKLEQNLEALQKEHQALKIEYNKLINNMADIQSKHDIMQKELEHQRSEVERLTNEKEDLYNKLDKRGNDYNFLNQRFIKAQQELNETQKDFNKYTEFKGMIKTFQFNLQSKGRITRWIAGLNTDIKLLDDNIKMLPEPKEPDK